MLRLEAVLDHFGAELGAVLKRVFRALPGGVLFFGVSAPNMAEGGPKRAQGGPKMGPNGEAIVFPCFRAPGPLSIFVL